MSDEITDQDIQDMQRKRSVILSPGHNPPKMVDRQLPTQEARIHGYGGPGKKVQGAQGTNPWVAGSMTIGSNKIFNLTLAKMQSSSANVWFKLRHSRSGSGATIAGGTLDEWYLQNAGRQIDVGDIDTPLRSFKGPGTLFLYGFGAGSLSGTTSNRTHKTLGTRGQDYYSALIRGYIN